MQTFQLDIMDRGFILGGCIGMIIDASLLGQAAYHSQHQHSAKTHTSTYR